MARWKRLAKLGGLTSKVTGSYLRNKVSGAFADPERRKRALDRLHIDNAEQVVEAMSRMKGAAMKLGQQLAVAASSLDLPEEVAAQLSRLHKDAEPVAFDIIREDVETELEQPLEEIFATFSPEPLGTASLAQAHLATLKDGTEVVVKVLHRGVEDSVDTDLVALKTVLVSGRLLRRDREEIEEAFDEIEARLREELDYLQEAANIHAFHHALQDVEGVRIPRLHTALCTERVLTLDRVPGKHLPEFLQTASPEARQRAGALLSDLYYRQLFRLRMLHADPHPGNYLFDEDGTVGLVDFGCVKRFDEFWIGTYAKAALATLERDKPSLLDACEQLGAWTGEDPEDGELLWEFCDTLGRGFRMGEIELGAAHEQFMEDMKPVIRRFLKRPSVRIPRHVLYAHRSMAGMYSLNRQLGTRADFGAILRRHAEHAVAVAEGRASG